MADLEDCGLRCKTVHSYWLKHYSIVSMSGDTLFKYKICHFYFKLWVSLNSAGIMFSSCILGWLHMLWVLNTNHTQSDNCVPYWLLGPCLTSLTHDIHDTGGWAKLSWTQVVSVFPSKARVRSLPPYQHWPSTALSTILLPSTLTFL